MTKCAQCMASIFLTFLPILSIFLVGYYFPPSKTEYKPVFQPPSFVFSIVWTYVTIALGCITVSALLQKNKPISSILVFYFLLVLTLNGWLVLNYFHYYKESFYLLLVTSFIAIVYQFYLGYLKIPYSFLLLPLPFWLVLATALNGSNYDYYAQR